MPAPPSATAPSRVHAPPDTREENPWLRPNPSGPASAPLPEHHYIGDYHASEGHRDIRYENRHGGRPQTNEELSKAMASFLRYGGGAKNVPLRVEDGFARLSDLLKALPGRKLDGCRWTEKDVQHVVDTSVGQNGPRYQLREDDKEGVKIIRALHKHKLDVNTENIRRGRVSDAPLPPSADSGPPRYCGPPRRERPRREEEPEPVCSPPSCASGSQAAPRSSSRDFPPLQRSTVPDAARQTTPPPPDQGESVHTVDSNLQEEIARLRAELSDERSRREQAEQALELAKRENQELTEKLVTAAKSVQELSASVPAPTAQPSPTAGLAAVPDPVPQTRATYMGTQPWPPDAKTAQVFIDGGTPDFLPLRPGDLLERKEHKDACSGWAFAVLVSRQQEPQEGWVAETIFHQQPV